MTACLTAPSAGHQRQLASSNYGPSHHGAGGSAPHEDPGPSTPTAGSADSTVAGGTAGPSAGADSADEPAGLSVASPSSLPLSPQAPPFLRPPPPQPSPLQSPTQPLPPLPPPPPPPTDTDADVVSMCYVPLALRSSTGDHSSHKIGSSKLSTQIGHSGADEDAEKEDTASSCHQQAGEK